MVIEGQSGRKSRSSKRKLVIKSVTFEGFVGTEVVFSDKLQAKKGVKTMDIAKRLIDYGFHPYTTAFPLIVPGALMIEPTESEPKEELDLFIEAMKSIAEEVEEDPKIVLDAPHTTRVSRLDETSAARKPILRWKPSH